MNGLHGQQCVCRPVSYIPRSDPDKIDVNVRCLDGVDLAQLEIETYDGRNWEEAYERYRGAD